METMFTFVLIRFVCYFFVLKL